MLIFKFEVSIGHGKPLTTIRGLQNSSFFCLDPISWLQLSKFVSQLYPCNPASGLYLYRKQKCSYEIDKSLNIVSHFVGTVNKAFEDEDDSIKDHHASFSELPDSLKFTQDPIVQNAINRKLSTRRPKPVAAEDNTMCGSSDNVATTPNGDQCKDNDNTIADVKL